MKRNRRFVKISTGGGRAIYPISWSFYERLRSAWHHALEQQAGRVRSGSGKALAPSSLKLAFAVITLSLLLGKTVRADSWPLPETETTCSANTRYCFTSIPRNWTQSNPARGMLKDGNHLLWDVPLSNTVTPLRALVSNDGHYVVTTGNWGSTGYGDDEIVLFGPGGKIIRKFALSEIMSPYDIENFALESVSSRHWEGLHSLSDDKGWLILKVQHGYAGKAPEPGNQLYLDTVIELRTGKVLWSNHSLSKPEKGLRWQTWCLGAMVYLGALGLIKALRRKSEN